MKIIKWVALVLISGVTLVALAGMYKFDYLASLDGYDVDGNKITNYTTSYGDYSYIVEEEVYGPEDCTKFEEYDAQHKVCFFECSTKEECDAIDRKIDEALEELGDEYEDFAKDFREFEGNIDDVEQIAEVIYKIEKGENFVVVAGSENTMHAKIKKWLTAISPDKFSDTYLSRLLLIPNSEDDSAAFVSPSNSGNNGTWDMFVNMKSMEDGEKEMVFTLIHEFAHILTLNNSQVDEDVSEKSCKNYFIDEGCVKTNAYLNTFYFNYWKDKFNPFVEDSDENFSKKPTAFVTEYAATNPAEDIAESFASFIFKKKPINEGTVANQKILFFYQYPELSEIRNSIRSELKSFVHKRMRK